MSNKIFVSKLQEVKYTNMEKEQKTYVCRCEEVTREEIIEAIKNGATTLNEVKRWTRAGMGLCQGKICSKNVAKIICEVTGKKIEEVIPSTTRQPVRPVLIDVIADKDLKEDSL